MIASEAWRRWMRADVVLTLVALVAGVLGAVLAGQFLATRAAAAEAELAGRYATEEVVVAAVDVKRGEPLDGANLALRKVPREFLPANAIPSARAGEALGGRAAIDLVRGTPIMAAAIATTAVPALSSVLSQGERAVTIPVDDLASHAGSLRSGDRIDLYFGQRQAGDALLVPLLQQVEILAVGDSFVTGVDGESRPYSTVTLRVQASDAPRVLLAQQAGDLQLLLRGAADQQAGPGEIRSSRELLKRQVPRSSGGGVEVLTGGNGKLTPDRTWLAVGAGANTGAT